MGRVGIKFGAGGTGQARLVAGPLDHGALHAQAQAQEGHLLFPCPPDSSHLAVHTAVAEAAGHHHRIHACQQSFCSLAFELLGAYPVQIKRSIPIQAGVAQGLHHR